jgi:hypothetical protein
MAVSSTQTFALSHQTHRRHVFRCSDQARTRQHVAGPADQPRSAGPVFGSIGPSSENSRAAPSHHRQAKTREVFGEGLRSLQEKKDKGTMGMPYAQPPQLIRRQCEGGIPCTACIRRKRPCTEEPDVEVINVTDGEASMGKEARLVCSSLPSVPELTVCKL